MNRNTKILTFKINLHLIMFEFYLLIYIKNLFTNLSGLIIG